MAGNGVGVGFGISDTAVAVAGTVALALIGGFTITHLAREHMHKRYWKGKHRVHEWHARMNHRHVMDEIYNECVASASHPNTVHRNRDRIYRAMHQRAPHIKELIMKAHHGHYGPHKMAEGIQNMSSDILTQFDIPQHPHASAANPRLVQLFKNQRHNDINYRYSIPGGLVLDPYERRYLDKELISYAGEAHGGHGGDRGGDHVGGFLNRDSDRRGFEGDRLRDLFGEREGRWAYRRERALFGLTPPWLMGDIAPIAPYYNPYPYYPPIFEPTYGPDLLHPNLGIGGLPFIVGGFPDRLGRGDHDRH